MSHRSIVVAAALQAEMPELLVQQAASFDAVENVSVFDGPVVTVCDGIARGFSLTLYGDEGDDIDGLAADIFRAVTKQSFDLGEEDGKAELSLTFHRSEPVLDDSSFRIGERLLFTPVECKQLIAA